MNPFISLRPVVKRNQLKMTGKPTQKSGPVQCNRFGESVAPRGKLNKPDVTAEICLRFSSSSTLSKSIIKKKRSDDVI